MNRYMNFTGEFRGLFRGVFIYQIRNVSSYIHTL